MKVEMRLQVSAESFWKIIKDSLRQDAGEDVELYEGMTFEKKLPTTLSGMRTAHVVVTEYKENQCYAADFATQRSTVHSAYRIVEQEDGILVSYEEDETFASKMDQWNAKIMQIFYKKSRTKKLIKKLKNIERYIKGEV